MRMYGHLLTDFQLLLNSAIYIYNPTSEVE